MNTYLPVCLLLLVELLFAASDCPPYQATMQALERSSGSPMHIDATCFSNALVTAPSTSAAVLFVNIFGKSSTVSDTILFNVYATKSLRENSAVFSTLLYLWKQQHPFAAQHLQELQAAGAFRAADTLCRILDNTNNSDPYLLLRWIEIKNVIDEQQSVPELVCRSIDSKPELLSLALDQFSRVLDELTPSLAQPLLETFIRCSTTLTAVKEECIDWIINQYSAKQLFAAQIAFVKNAVDDSTRRGELFTTIADNAFRAQKLSDAIDAARLAYSIVPDTMQKKELAALLYTAFSKLEKTDSAKIWFKLTDPAAATGDPYATIDAYIEMGDYTKAKALLASRSGSFVRDTLQLRILLLSDSAKAAFALASSTTQPLARTPVAPFWQIRTALFSQNLAICKTLLDSVQFRPSDTYADELISYRYWFSRLSSTPEDLAKFAQIEYTLYKGKRDLAAAVACSSTVSPENRWRLAAYIARKQLAHAEPEAALATLRCVPADSEPEYLFCFADASYRLGDTVTAGRLLERIIVDFPSGRYTAQARLLLSKIGKHRGTGVKQ